MEHPGHNAESSKRLSTCLLGVIMPVQMNKNWPKIDFSFASVFATNFFKASFIKIDTNILNTDCYLSLL